MLIFAERIRYRKIDIILDGYHAVIITYLKSVLSLFCSAYQTLLAFCAIVSMHGVKPVYCSHVIVLYKYIITILFLYMYHSKFNYQFHFYCTFYILFLTVCWKNLNISFWFSNEKITKSSSSWTTTTTP